MEKEEPARTIEVKGICKKTSQDTLENYFSSTRRGGEISNIQYDKNEGTAFVTFEKPEGARQALQSSPHCIDQVELTIQSKLQAVKVETNKLYIEGFGENTSSDCLKYYVENISGTDVSEVVFGSRCNAIMTVNGELDFDRIHRRSQTKPLEGNVLIIKRVPAGRTIKVTDLPPSATKDSIMYKFESPKSGGGEVESVQVNLQERTALVEFKDPTVLTNVLSRDQMLDAVQLKVTPYHLQLGGLRREQPQIPIHDSRVHEPAIVRDQPSFPSTKPVACEPVVARESPLDASPKHFVEIDRDLFQYLTQHHPQNLKMALKGRQPRIDERKDTVVVTVESGEAENEIKAFLNDYKCAVVEFDPVLADKGLPEKMVSVLGIFESSTAVSFEVHYPKGFIKIVGRAINAHTMAVEEVEQCVNSTKEENEEKMKQGEELIETSSVNLKLLQSSEKYRASERAWAQQGVDVHLVADSGVSVKGSQSQVNTVRREIEQLVGSFGQRELDQKPSVLLKTPAAVAYVKELLLENDLSIEFSTNEGEKIVLHGPDQATVDEAYQYIISTVRETKIPMSGTNVRFQQQEFRDKVVSTVGSSTPISLQIESDELWLVCFEKDLSAVRHEVANVMEEKKHTEASVPLDKAVARYLQLYGEGILQGLQLSSPGITIKQSADAGVSVSGPRPLVAACEASLRKVIGELSKETVNFGTPETCAIITGGTTRQIIGIEKLRRCAIVVNVSEESEKPRCTPGHRSTNAEETRELMERTRQCRYVYPNGKIIEVHQGDILDHPAKFLVNAANAELRHSGGIAKAIVDRGGCKIQEDCFSVLEDMGKSKLMPGDVVVTDGGKLLCDKVLHVVVPKWSQCADSSGGETGCEGTKEGRYLRHACFDVFNKAKDGPTVAIPALGTGIYNIPHNISARSLVTAADEFLREGSPSGLKEVHFVDNEPRAVEAFMKEMIDKYGSDYNFHINDSVRHRWASSPRINVPASEEVVLPDVGNEFSTNEGMKIQLTVGNIAKCKADVIINTVHSNLDLTKNPCSKAILDVAGQELAKYCEVLAKAKGDLKQGDFVVTEHAKLECEKVFHICCPLWTDNGGEKNLSKLVQKLLSEAMRLKLTSVATPALGTGSLKYPEATVAKVLFEQAIKFSATHGASSRPLKRIEIVVFEGNAAVVKEFKEKFKFYSTKCTPKPGTVRRTIRTTRKTKATMKTERPSSFAIPRRTSEIDGVEMRERISESMASANVDSNDLVVEIVLGDMVQECTGAIGLLVGNIITRSGQLGEALIARGGEALRREYAGLTKVESGTVVTTSAGDLKVNYLLHMVPKKTYLDNVSSKSMRDSVVKCLEEAEVFGLESISLPAVGTGALKKDGEGSAEVIYESISEYAKRPIRSLKLIRVVILRENVFEKFSNGFMKRQQENPLPRCSVSVNSTDSSKVPPAGNDRSNPKEISSRVRKRISLDIVGDRSTNMAEIKRDLAQIERELCKDINVEEEAIAEMPQVYLDKIIDELQSDCCVLIECKREVGYLRISGLSENVINASQKIYQMISAYEREKHKVAIISQPVQWLFYDGSECDGDIVIPESYAPNDSGQIEKAYQEKLPSVEIGDDQLKFKINFGTMDETNLANGQVMKVLRRSREGFPLPELWDCQPIATATGQEEEVHLTPVDPQSQPKEFDDVYDMFRKTMPQATVESIQRIQNPRLYQIYKGQQKKMDERGDCNEQKLFHGTNKETVPSINNKGFNRAYCGKNATKYGKGVYFARDASYSARPIYAIRDDKGVQYMYIARVLVGRYTKGAGNLIVPPPIDDKPNASYDTVVDDVSNPSMFVVFYDYQCYPEYLISFKNATK